MNLWRSDKTKKFGRGEQSREEAMGFVSTGSSALSSLLDLEIRFLQRGRRGKTRPQKRRVSPKPDRSGALTREDTHTHSEEARAHRQAAAAAQLPAERPDAPGGRRKGQEGPSATAPEGAPAGILISCIAGLPDGEKINIPRFRAPVGGTLLRLPQEADAAGL